MRRPWRRILWGLAMVVVVLMTVAPPAMAAQISAGGGGGASSGNGAGTGGSTQCPPPPGQPDPPGCIYIKSTFTRDAYDTEIPSIAYYIGTGQWKWWAETADAWYIEWDPGYPQYNKWIYDPTSDKVLKYEFVGVRAEGPYYIEDEYRPLVRKYYDMWQLEHGMLYNHYIWWSEIMGWPKVIVYVWNNGWSFPVSAGTYNPNRTSITFNNLRPIHGIEYCPARCSWRFPFENPQSPRSPLVKNPPIYNRNPDGREKPPITSAPLDWLGDQIDCDNCQHKDVYDPNGVFLFGGRPSRNLFSGTRGRQAVFGIDTLAQGDLSVPPAKNRVDEVIVRVPDLGIGAKMALYDGNRQRGQWITALVIPWDARIGRYKVEFVVSGRNYWGERREKVVYGWLQVDGGSCAPTDRRCQMEPPGPVSYCGLSEDQMREMGPVWEYRCRDPRLIR